MLKDTIFDFVQYLKNIGCNLDEFNAFKIDENGLGFSFKERLNSTGGIVLVRVIFISDEKDEVCEVIIAGDMFGYSIRNLKNSILNLLNEINWMSSETKFFLNANDLILCETVCPFNDNYNHAIVAKQIKTLLWRIDEVYDKIKPFM